LYVERIADDATPARLGAGGLVLDHPSLNPTWERLPAAVEALTAKAKTI
jgi:hypothetical protein